MASKGKLKRYETKFKDKRIDVKRFAYDVISYIALKFKVPKNCICIWEGSENDYGCSNFLLVMSRLILRHEIAIRYKLHMYFNDRFESNKLESFESVGYLLQDAIKQVTKYSPYTIVDELEVSLSIVCELVQFLYSKNLNLYVKKLAEYWFGCYFCLVKKRFEKERGIDHMYEKGNKTKHELLDDYYKHFIQVYCQSYEDSAKNKDLEEIYYKSSLIFKKKFVSALSSEDRQKLGEEMRDSPSISYIARLDVEIEVSVPSSILKLDEDLDRNILENHGLGILPHEELLKSIRGTSPGATLPQNLPSKSPKESAKHCRGLSRRQKGKSRFCSNILDLGTFKLDSLSTKQLRKETPIVSVTDGSTQPANSPTSKRDKASTIDLIKNTGLGIRPNELLKSIHDTEPGAKLSQNLSESQQETGKHCTELSRKQKGKPRLCSSIEQVLEQLSLDFSRAKQLRKPDVSVTDGSPRSVISSTLKRAETLAIDLIEKTGLGMRPHEELLKSIHDTGPGEKLSQNLPVKSPQESAEHGRGLLRRQKSKPRLCSSVKQGHGQLSLGSTSEKQLRKIPDVSITDDSTRFEIHPSVSGEPAKEQ